MSLQLIGQTMCLSPGTVSPEDLISYAHKISLASSIVSPVGWQPSELAHYFDSVQITFAFYHSP